MPKAPELPPEVMAKLGMGKGINPANFLMAAAEADKTGGLTEAAAGRSIPSSGGKALQTGKRRKGPMRVLK